MDDLEPFTVLVRPLPDSVPVATRIKAWLKRGLRSFNLRAVTLGVVPQTPAVPAAQDHDRAGFPAINGHPYGSEMSGHPDEEG
jgi:hypothetical protein